MSAPGDWYLDIAEVPTVNDHLLAIGAQYVGGDRIVTLDGHGIDVAQASALVAAINRAVDVLSLA